MSSGCVVENTGGLNGLLMHSTNDHCSVNIHTIEHNSFFEHSELADETQPNQVHYRGCDSHRLPVPNCNVISLKMLGSKVLALARSQSEPLTIIFTFSGFTTVHRNSETAQSTEPKWGDWKIMREFRDDHGFVPIAMITKEGKEWAKGCTGSAGWICLLEKGRERIKTFQVEEPHS